MPIIIKKSSVAYSLVKDKAKRFYLEKRYGEAISILNSSMLIRYNASAIKIRAFIRCFKLRDIYAAKKEIEMFENNADKKDEHIIALKNLINNVAKTAG
jgi:hypothetical protein